MQIVIYGRIPSKKNSKQIFRNRLFPSKNYIKRQKDQSEYLKSDYKIDKIYSSCMIEITVYFPDKRKSDLTNKVESIMDLLVDCWIIEDDNHTVVTKLFLYSGWVDKDNPRANIHILE